MKNYQRFLPDKTEGRVDAPPYELVHVEDDGSVMQLLIAVKSFDRPDKKVLISSHQINLWLKIP